MARYTGPKNKLARKIGEDLGLKSNALKVAKRLTSRPGQHGAKGRRKVSDYGVQLKEKQKVKFMYGIQEKQMRRLYDMATKTPTGTGNALLALLERRIDNVVYRMGWAPTRAAARQLVNHGNVLLNSKKMSIPSYKVLINDVLTLKPKATTIPVVSALLKEEGYVAPEWLERKGPAGKIARFPQREDIKEVIEEQLIVEFYSR